MTLYYGYCLTPGPDARWAPKVSLRSAQEAFDYCQLHHALFPEIIITDEHDACMMRVKDHICYVVYPDNIAKRLDLQHMAILDDIGVWDIPEGTPLC